MEPSVTERADFYNLEYAAKLGKLLPAASARALEKVLPHNPQDLVTRARLLGHYWIFYKDMRAKQSAANQQRCKLRCDHILWFVENAPDCVFAGDYYLCCDPGKDKKHYNRIKAAWRKQIKSTPSCAQTHVNFALFLFEHEPNSARTLLRRVLQLEPLNEWALALLPTLGPFDGQSLPLPADLSAEQLPPSINQRMRDAEKMTLSWTTIFSGISQATVDTLESVLKLDPFDLWARVDILHWCESQMERANVLGHNPRVVQSWLRHCLWIVNYFPHVRLGGHFGFGAKIPRNYAIVVKDAFLQGIRLNVEDKEQVFRNSFRFLVRNFGLASARRVLCELEEWQKLPSSVRRKLQVELADHARLQAPDIFKKRIDLNDVARFQDSYIPPCLMPTELSMWANDLDLSRANSQGLNAPTDSTANLKRLGVPFAKDLITTIRIAGSCGRRQITEAEVAEIRPIVGWVIQAMPESDIATSLSDRESCDVLNCQWNEQIEAHPHNMRIAMNAALWLYLSDATSAIQIAKSVLEQSPDDAEALALVYAIPLGQDLRVLDFRDEPFEKKCEKIVRNFEPQANDRVLAKLCDRIGRSGLFIFSLLYSLSLPTRTVWTNEQALKINPNDLILRAEVLGWCDRNNLTRGTFVGPTNPQIARIRTEHVLWLLEHVPNANLHFFKMTEHDGLSHKKIWESAVRTLRKMHGPHVARYRPEFPKRK